MIFTFYSYKGGVGRSMALANVAEIFYQQGKRVLMVDWDLEAPGLESFFPSVNPADVANQAGLIDMFIDYKKAIAAEASVDEQLSVEHPSHYTVDVYPNSTEGKLLLITAGMRAGNSFARYAESVLDFDWHDFYLNWEGELYIDWLREGFQDIADVVLIDSRTGVTEMSGICTYQMADMVVMFCGPNQQIVDGTYQMAVSFTSEYVANIRRELPLYTLIVPSRVERADSLLLDRFQVQFSERFDRLVPPVAGLDIKQLWNLAIPYIPKYAYSEAVAVRESDLASADEMVSAMRRLVSVLQEVDYSLKKTTMPLAQNSDFDTTSMQSTRPRILIVDTDPLVRDSLSKLISSWGYNPVVAEGVGSVLIDDAMRKAHAYRCHIAVVEIRLRASDDLVDRSGLDLVPKLRPTVSILYSTSLDSESVRRGAQYAAISVSKSESPKTLQGAIQETLRREWANFVDVRIEWVGGWNPTLAIRELIPDVNDVPEGQVNDIIRMLYPSAKLIVLEQTDITFASPIKQASGSLIFKMTVDDKLPSFVKIAKAEAVAGEVERYHDYVEGRLGGMSYARLQSHVELWDLGGIEYAFIGSQVSVNTFSEHFQRNTDIHEIVQPLERFFNSIWSRLYQQTQPLHKSLFDAYDSTYGNAISRYLNEMKSTAVRRPSFPGLPDELPEPSEWVRRNRSSAYLPNLRSCVTHGDLHGDNLLVNEDGSSVWVIDFERTGSGPVLQDFVELEQDIFTRLLQLPNSDSVLVYELAIALTSPILRGANLTATRRVLDDPNTKKSFNVIANLRNLATRHTEYDDNRVYLWSLLLNLLLLLTLEQHVEERYRRASLLASIVCSRLDHWNEDSWPPKSWPQVEWAVRLDVMDHWVRFPLSEISEIQAQVEAIGANLVFQEDSILVTSVDNALLYKALDFLRLSLSTYKIVIMIPQNRIPLVIGKAGRTVESIEQASNSRVTISRQNPGQIEITARDRSAAVNAANLIEREAGEVTYLEETEYEWGIEQLA